MGRSFERDLCSSGYCEFTLCACVTVLFRVLDFNLLRVRRTIDTTHVVSMGEHVVRLGAPYYFVVCP